MNKNKPKKSSQKYSAPAPAQRTEEVIALIQKIEKLEKLSTTGIEKQKIEERLQILPGNQTGIVLSFR